MFVFEIKYNGKNKNMMGKKVFQTTNNYGCQTFGAGVRISKGIAFEISQKPKIMQNHLLRSLDSFDKYSKAKGLDVSITKQSLSRGKHNLHANYSRIHDNIRGSVVKKEKFFGWGSFSSLQRKLSAKFGRKPLFERLKLFLFSGR